MCFKGRRDVPHGQEGCASWAGGTFFRGKRDVQHCQSNLKPSRASARKARPPPPHLPSSTQMRTQWHKAVISSDVAGRIRRATTTAMTSLLHNGWREGQPESGAPSSATSQHSRRGAREGSGAEQVLLYWKYVYGILKIRVVYWKFVYDLLKICVWITENLYMVYWKYVYGLLKKCVFGRPAGGPWTGRRDKKSILGRGRLGVSEHRT